MTTYTFLLHVRDRAGVLETIAATFAHRGISLSATQATDGSLDPQGLGSVLVTFCASPARKDAVKAALSRLSWVVSVTERTQSDVALRQSALVRLAPGAVFDASPAVFVDNLAADHATGEILVALFGPPSAVDALLRGLRDQGVLRAVTFAVIAV
jgi:acetolactate synthase small subunit